MSQDNVDKAAGNVLSIKVRKLLRRFMGRSYDVTIEEGQNNGRERTRIRFEQRDSGNELMTYGDVAARLNLDIATVRQMAGSRARERAIAAGRMPFPMTLDRGGPRIRRSELIAWELAQ